MSTMLALGRQHAGGNHALGCWRPTVWATSVDVPLLVVGYVTSLKGAPIEVGSPAMSMWLVVTASMTLLAGTWTASSRAATRTGWITGAVSVLTMFAGVVTMSW